MKKTGLLIFTLVLGVLVVYGISRATPNSSKPDIKKTPTQDDGSPKGNGSPVVYDKNLVKSKILTITNRDDSINYIVWQYIIPEFSSTSSNNVATDSASIQTAMLSRCPSGYNFALFLNQYDTLTKGQLVDVSKTSGYNTVCGVLMYNVGCNSKIVCDFKIDLSASMFWLKDDKAPTYVSAEEYLKQKKQSATRQSTN